MATIVTVHGTFATGPEQGDGWWQKGGAFEAELARLVEGADGRLEVVPHVWDGLNSETSRRAAGVALAGRMAALEAKGERYSVIGHSHGGSVILASVFHNAYTRRLTPGLSRWITVGTPFIAFARKRLLFTRLGLLGKATYIALLTFTTLMALVFWIDNRTKDLGLVVFFTTLSVAVFMLVHLILGWITDRGQERRGASFAVSAEPSLLLPRLGLFGRFVYAVVVGSAGIFAVATWFGDTMPFGASGRALAIAGILAFIVGFHFAMRWLSGRLRQTGEKQAHRAVRVAFERWMPLRHPDDEAIEGLRQLHKVSFPIFGRDFAVAPLMLTAVLSLPALVGAALLTPELMVWIYETTKPEGFSPRIVGPDGLAGGGRDVVVNFFLLMGLPLVKLFPGLSNDKLTMLFFIIGPLLFLASMMLLVALARGVSTLVSRILSRALDLVAWSQIRVSAFGNDTQGENALAASAAPGLAKPPAVLPPELAREISAVADTAAVAAIPKLRQSLNRLAFSEDERARSDLVSDYLTWDELIHTAYFKAPRLCKLIAYAIATSEGFRPSAAFRADPDFETVARWHAELAAST